jgi:hypothetical protein
MQITLHSPRDNVTKNLHVINLIATASYLSNLNESGWAVEFFFCLLNDMGPRQSYYLVLCF